MPAVKQISTKNYEVLVWKIEEDLDFFAQNIQLSFIESQDYATITKEYRKLEWMASRYVLRQLIQDSLIKDEWGKPKLASKNGFVSITHCENYAAAMFSAHLPVGIDIEPLDDKVLRIADKFLNQTELDFMDKTNRTVHVISSWCIKEAVYKWYGKRSLSFKNNIKIRPFGLKDFEVNVDFELENQKIIREVQLFKIEECMLAFTF